MGAGWFGGIFFGAYSNGGTAEASDSAASRTPGKYAVEHASAFVDVGAVESGDFAPEHAGTLADVLEAGV